MTFSDRTIGKHTGAARHGGPLLFVFGAMHGNEPAGPTAIAEVFSMLENEPFRNPFFEFRGAMVGLVGHLRAFEKGLRFIEKDLNRIWSPDHVDAVLRSKKADLPPESLEMREILDTLKTEIDDRRPDEIWLLDLHTTSARGGIFSIPSEDEGSLFLAREIHAPVVRDLLDGLENTTLHFFSKENFEWAGLFDGLEKRPRSVVAVAFEAGQHFDPESASRSVAAVVQCLRAVGCVKKEDVESQHEAVLRRFSDGLPTETRLAHVHKIHAGDDFEMRPGFSNFQKIEKGQRLADDRNGPILAPIDAHILMPLYQKQGGDGFFLVEEI